MKHSSGSLKLAIKKPYINYLLINENFGMVLHNGYAVKLT